MLELNITKEIFTSFVGTLLAILSAGVIWLVRSAYGKHRSEILALRKFETVFANNLTSLTDNFEFIDKWIDAVKNSRPYSFQLRKFTVNEEEIYKISNVRLINKVLSVNYMLSSLNLDLNNIYKSYWEILSRIDSYQDEQRKIKELQIYHNTIREHLEQIKQGYDPVKNNTIEVVAMIRVAANIRFHSIFGYLAVLFRDVFPRMDDEAIKVEIESLTKQINERIAARGRDTRRDTNPK